MLLLPDSQSHGGGGIVCMCGRRGPQPDSAVHIVAQFDRAGRD